MMQKKESIMVKQFINKCCVCGKEIIANRPTKVVCSMKCKRIKYNIKSRQEMRKLREEKRLEKQEKILLNRSYKKYGIYTKGVPCQVCGWNTTVDVHHEGDDLYILCPNHHALITRRKRTIEDYNIKPMDEKESYELYCIYCEDAPDEEEKNEWYNQ
jgi:hypothetical protein